jgi:polysaccharide export outer membrane protein
MSDLSAVTGSIRSIFLIGLVALAPFVLGAKTAAPPAAPPPAQPAVGETVSTQAPYVIGIGDTIGIHIWRDPDLTRDGIVVRPDGRISLPLVGDVQAAGITPPALSAMVTERMKEFITDPHVTVIIEKINSYRIYVLGHVLKSGEYTFQQPTRLAEALATAGGFDQFADLNHIVVLSSRGGGGGQARIEIDFKRIVSGSRLDDNIFLRPGDTVIVP